jgi:hypothetical protein
MRSVHPHRRHRVIVFGRLELPAKVGLKLGELGEPPAPDGNRRLRAEHLCRRRHRLHRVAEFVRARVVRFFG